MHGSIRGSGWLTRVWGLWLPLAVVLVWFGAALAGPGLAIEGHQIALPRILAPPSWHGSAEGWAGFDALGRSVAERLVSGATTSLLVAVVVISVSLVAGVAIGGLSGYTGGVVDLVIVRIIDVFLAFPGILLAIALAAVLGPGVNNVVIALAAVGWVGFARITRAQALSLKSHPHVVAARALGVPTHRIVSRHIVPLTAAPLIVEATFGIASVVIAEAGLSFLGLGVQPPRASWGSILLEGTRYMLVAPHLVLAPAMAICLTVLSVNLLGDRVRDWLDVRN